MIDVFKCSTNVEQIKAKVEVLGAERFEMQFLDSEIGLSKEYLFNIMRNCIEVMPDVISIHTPLTKVPSRIIDGNVGLQYIEDHTIMECIYSTCAAAQLCANHYGHDVGVVIHNSLSFQDFMAYDSLRETIVHSYKLLLEMFPNTMFYVENVTPWHSRNNHWRNGALSDTAEIVVWLRDNYGLKFHTLFDTCHGLLTARILNAMMPEKDVNATFRDIANAYAHTCQEIHLANGIDLGLQKGQHGVGFTHEHMDMLTFIMQIITELFPDAYLCYEIAEKDYLTSPNTLLTRNLVREIKL